MKKTTAIQHLFYGLFFLVVYLSPKFLTGQECPTIRTNGVFNPNDDVLISSYHQSIARTTTGYVTWGEDMAADGSDAIALTDITPGNGYGYSGDLIQFAVSGNSDGQAFLATTDNLYAWGGVGEVVDGNFVTGNSFAPMLNLPFAGADIRNMHASSDVLFVLLNSGEIWVATNGITVVNGNDSTDATVWQQVQTSAGTPLTGAVQVTGNRSAGFALMGNGDIFAWGDKVELGNGGGLENFDFATQMVAPPVPVTYITALHSNGSEPIDNSLDDPGLLALGSDTKIYGVGDNTAGEIITTGTGVVSTWTAVQDGSGSDFTGALYLSTSHTSEEWSGAAVITAGATATDPNILFTWGSNNINSIGQGGDGTIQDPTVPPSFNVGSDNPVAVSVGGHASTFFNRSGGGSICFVGHISNSSTGALTTGDGSTFECVIPATVELCGVSQISIVARDDLGNTVVEGTGGVAIASVLENDELFAETPTVSNVTLTQVGTTDPGVTLNTATGEVSVDGAVNPGTYTLEYQICETASPSNCNTAIATVKVAPDTDRDGIANSEDLDDDNDGIPDTLECGGAGLGLSLLANGDFGVADIANDSFFGGPGNGSGNPDNYSTYTKPMPATITTTYGYDPPRPSDGNYAVVTNSVGFSYLGSQPIPNFWLDTADFSNDPTGKIGYFALFNAAGGAGTFFEQTIPNLVIGEKYEFTSAIINLFNSGYLDNGTEQFLGNTPIAPNISMVVSDTDGNIIAQFDSGDIPNDGIWKEVSLIFAATETELVLSVRNNTPGGLGNDFGIDNVSLQIVCDFDNDGITNDLDLDSDNDGILDIVEAGGVDSDQDGRVDGFVDDNSDGLDDSIAATPLLVPNSDNNAGDQPDFIDIDADDDGLPDNIEGQPTATYDPPSGMGAAMTDANNNGVDDTYENGAVLGLIPENTDRDSDPDYIDSDSDNDLIDDLTEGARGTFAGSDNDNDGLDDGFEGGDNDDPTDINDEIDDPTTLPDIQKPGDDVDYREGLDNDGDGINDDVDLDDDNDGIPDTVEGDGDTDGDGIKDSFDLDSDNDGILDVTEAGGTDTDGDGLIDDFIDDNDDGLSDPLETAPLPNPDSDDDGIDDRLDLDSDNDGISDVTEAGGPDVDGDGVIDGFTDTDNDGLADSVDPIGPATPGTPLPDTNSDSDGIPDRLDVDSDNDGLTDVTEAGGTDADNDGRIDGFTDADDDGFADSVDTDDNNTSATLDGPGTSLPQDDFDGDGRPNYLDIDSDNDGLTDALEAGGADTDGNGEIDGFTDADGDGFDDATAASPLPVPNSDENVGDGPDYLDIDADDDGLPDNIEAQPTIGYLTPSGTSAPNGLDTAYTVGFVPEDTDRDMIPDYLDTDSDNDEIDDPTEGGRGTLAGADTDSDGLDDGFEGANLTDPTDVNDEIDDPTTLPDVQLVGGDVDYRQGLDADGDGVLDDQEVADGTDPNDPCDFMVASITEPQGGDFLTADCDGDGVTNGDELAGPDGDPATTDDNTDPQDPCDFDMGSITVDTSETYLSTDCDGDGVTNGMEITDGTDPTDPCDFTETSISLDRSGDYLTADCDGDQIPNGQEVTDGTDPADPCSSRGGTPPSGVACDVIIETDLVQPGINDGVFRITNIESYPDNTVRIYNRWGILVFETDGYDNGGNAFRGISNGRATISEGDKLPVGVYFYIIDYVNSSQANTKNGYLYVNR